jgi:hypothetical protein
MSKQEQEPGKFSDWTLDGLIIEDDDTTPPAPENKDEQPTGK